MSWLEALFRGDKQKAVGGEITEEFLKTFRHELLLFGNTASAEDGRKALIESGVRHKETNKNKKI